MVEVSIKVVVASVVVTRATMVVVVATTTMEINKVADHTVMVLHVKFSKNLVILQTSASRGSPELSLHLKYNLV
jgi:hypothetical protein